MAKILIIDDDKIMCDLLSEMVREMGHHTQNSQRLKDGLKIAAFDTFDIVFLDVRMPDGNGLDAIPEIKETPSSPEIIIITGMGDADGAELAINSGAWDYIEKASSIKDMRLSLKRALQYRDQKNIHKAPIVLNRKNILGHSKKIDSCLDQSAQAAFSAANVLITGETGTGKELFAQAIHYNSLRSEKDFVVVDCAALPATLVESMLFGYEKGAFTGADSPKQGLIGQADGGTLFLDEMGELSLSIQKTFLRVLQERRFRPLGGKREIKSDFRLVSATNQDLDKKVRKGEFRKDLLFRLQTISIHLPSLRERPEDIREIARFHMAKICKLSKTPEKGFSDGFFQILESYHWPGNVRELINTIEKAVTESQNEPILFDRHLPTHIRAQAVRKKIGKKSQPVPIRPESSRARKRPPKIRDFLDSMRAEYLQELITYTDGDVNQACELSGLSRAHLYKVLKAHNLSMHRSVNKKV